MKYVLRCVFIVQTFNSCTSRPDVSQCLVLQTSLNKHIKASFRYEVIHAQETGWKSHMRSCIMPGRPMHFLHELNVGTVAQQKIVMEFEIRNIVYCHFSCRIDCNYNFTTCSCSWWRESWYLKETFAHLTVQWPSYLVMYVLLPSHWKYTHYLLIVVFKLQKVHI